MGTREESNTITQPEAPQGREHAAPPHQGSLHGLGLGTLLFASSSCLALGEVWYRTAYSNNRRPRPDTDGEAEVLSRGH